jgi:twitching motility protein PilT
MPALAPWDTRELCLSLLSRAARKRLESAGETTVVFSVKGLARFKATVILGREGVEGVVKRIWSEILGPKELGMTPGVVGWVLAPRGLLLVSGPPRSGVSNVEAALIDKVNGESPRTILALENPVEIPHSPKRGTVTQRAVNWETTSVEDMLRSVHNLGADIVVVRDVNSRVAFECVAELARAGLLVVASLRAASCVDGLRRFLISCPSLASSDGRSSFAGDLLGVLNLRLLPRTTGKGLALAMESLEADAAVRAMIRAGQLDQIPPYVRSGEAPALSVSPDHAIARLLQGRQITRPTAMAHADNPEEVLRLEEQLTREYRASLRLQRRRDWMRRRGPARPIESSWTRMKSALGLAPDSGLARRGRPVLINLLYGPHHRVGPDGGVVTRMLRGARALLLAMLRPRPKPPVTMPWHHRHP